MGFACGPEAGGMFNGVTFPPISRWAWWWPPGGGGTRPPRISLPFFVDNETGQLLTQSPHCSLPHITGLWTEHTGARQPGRQALRAAGTLRALGASCCSGSRHSVTCSLSREPRSGRICGDEETTGHCAQPALLKTIIKATRQKD